MEVAPYFVFNKFVTSEVLSTALEKTLVKENVVMTKITTTTAKENSSSVEYFFIKRPSLCVAIKSPNRVEKR